MFSKTTLDWGDEFEFLQVPHESSIDHTLHDLATDNWSEQWDDSLLGHLHLYQV